LIDQYQINQQSTLRSRIPKTCSFMPCSRAPNRIDAVQGMSSSPSQPRRGRSGAQRAAPSSTPSAMVPSTPDHPGVPGASSPGASTFRDCADARYFPVYDSVWPMCLFCDYLSGLCATQFCRPRSSLCPTGRGCCRSSLDTLS
jgi:hypothetical protein